MKILLVNDDGIYAPGLRAMAKEFEIVGKSQERNNAGLANCKQRVVLMIITQIGQSIRQ